MRMPVIAMAQPPIQPEPRPHRAGHPGERGPAVGVDPVERREGRRDEQHRHERGQQHAGRVHPRERDERAEDGRQRVGRRGRGQPDHQGVEEADRPGRRVGSSSGRTAGCAGSAVIRRLSQPRRRSARVSPVPTLLRRRKSSARVTGTQRRSCMRILLVGAGGVGGAITWIAARRTFVERLVVADYDLARAEKAVAAVGDPRFVAARVDATDEAAVAALLAEHRCDALLNATDPRFVMPLFRAALAARRALPGHGHVAVPPASGAPLRGDRASSSATSSSRWPPSGRRRAGSRWSASGSSPAWPTSSPATPPTTCSPRSTSSASGTART